jgi:hypothetical protein
MIFTPRAFYTKNSECLITLFDLRYPEAEERLRREQVAWCGFSCVERLTAETVVLVVHPGGATRLTS